MANTERPEFFCLDQDEGVIQGDGNLKKFITNYYKGLFGEPASNHFSIVESAMHSIRQVSQLENEVLTAHFSESKIK